MFIHGRLYSYREKIRTAIHQRGCLLRKGPLLRSGYTITMAQFSQFMQARFVVFGVISLVR